MACPFGGRSGRAATTPPAQERAVRITTDPWRRKPARRCARRDGSQREPFHLAEPFHRSVWLADLHFPHGLAPSSASKVPPQAHLTSIFFVPRLSAPLECGQIA